MIKIAILVYARRVQLESLDDQKTVISGLRQEIMVDEGHHPKTVEWSLELAVRLFRTS